MQVNWEGLKLNGACQLLVCTKYVDLLRENMHTNTGGEALLDNSKVVGLEANTEKLIIESLM